MDALGELVAGTLELVVDLLPFRVSAAIAANVAVMYFALEWVTKHETSPAAGWVFCGGWIALPLASVALLLWHRRLRREGAGRPPEPASRIAVSPGRPRSW
jgi:hypothetical protein